MGDRRVTATLTERLKTRTTDVTRAALARYWQLVCDYASGKDIGTVEAASILLNANKTHSDLENAKTAYSGRLALVAEIQRGPAAKERLERVSALMAKAQEKRHAAEMAFRQAMAPLVAEAAELERLIDRAERGARTQ